MSRLESSVKESLTPLIERHDVKLSVDDMYRVLVWATLRIIILDLGEPIRIISQNERKKFFNDNLPLDKMTIWFGKTNTDYPFFYALETSHYSNIIGSLNDRNTRSYIWMDGGFIVYAIYHNGPVNFNNLGDLPSSKSVFGNL